MGAVRLLELAKSGVELTNDEELTIAQNASASYDYAELNSKRFIKGEAEIAKSRKLSIRYAMSILKGRFELGELYWVNDSDWCFEYAQHVIKGRFEPGETAIGNSKLKGKYQKMYSCKLEKAKVVEADDWDLLAHKFVEKLRKM